MRFVRLPSAIAVAVMFLAACGKETPKPPPPPAETARDAMRSDDKDIAERLAKVREEAEKNDQVQREKSEKTRILGILESYRTGWATALGEVERTGRSELEAKLKVLRDIRAKSGQVETSNCTRTAMQTFVLHMDKTIDAYTLFSKETGAGSDASRSMLQEAVKLVSDVDGQLAECRP